MNKFFKIILFVLLMGYIASPADIMPGPVDDVILALCYFVMYRHNSNSIDE